MEFQGGNPVSMDGPLAPFATDLRRELAGRGYSLRSAGELMRLAARLSRWLDSRGLTADDLTAAVVEEFFRARRADGCRRRPPTPPAASWSKGCSRSTATTCGPSAGWRPAP